MINLDAPEFLTLGDYPDEDEDTNELVEPYEDNGSPTTLDH